MVRVIKTAGLGIPLQDFADPEVDGIVYDDPSEATLRFGIGYRSYEESYSDVEELNGGKSPGEVSL